MNDNARKLASDLQQFLNDKEQMTKKANVKKDKLLCKLASAEEENRILSETLDLVSKGVIDPSDAMDKAEEFRQDPQQIEVIKAAYEMGFDAVPSVGSPVSEGPVEQEHSNALTRVLSELEPRLRRKW